MAGPSVSAVGSVQEALSKTGLASLRDLQVEEGVDVVVVSGRVPSYYCKQVAQETVVSAAGSRRVIIRISVVPPSRPGTTVNEP